MENGVSYLAGIEAKSSLNDALAYCNEKGGILAEPSDSSAQSALESLMGNKRWWIGATDTLSEGNFVWMSGAPWSYTNWHSGEPDEGGNGEDCVLLLGSHGGSWIDVPCDGYSYKNPRPLCQWKGKYLSNIF